MKRDKDRIDRLYSFFNAIRGTNTPSEYENTLAVLKKVIDIHEQAIDELSDDDLYNIMRQVAADFEVINPFPDKNKFFDVYRTLRGFETVTWADIIEYGDRHAKFRVPEALVDEMEKNFIDGFQEVLPASLKTLESKHICLQSQRDEPMKWLLRDMLQIQKTQEKMA